MEIALELVEPKGGARWLAPDLIEKVDRGWQLVGSKCEQCGARYFPRTTVCASCLGRDVSRVHLSAKGRLYTLTTVAMAPPGFSAPYRLGWVDLDDGPRVFGQVIPADSDEPRIGDVLTVAASVIRTDPDGTPVYGHAFTPE
jgi:uncharacterized protein